MFLWFIGGAWVLVYVVFQSPGIDYRLVALGAVLPLLDGLTGGAWLLHTLLFSVALLVAVLVLTREQRLKRRRWLGLPIGTFLHLVLDFVWTNAAVFWWPFFGSSFAGEALPEFDRGGLPILLEAFGFAGLVLFGQRVGLDQPYGRRQFVKTGRLPR